MKKLLFTVAALFAFGFANAQDGEMSYGVKAGYASLMSKVEIGGVSASGSDGGFFIGGVLDMPLSEKISFKPELLYVAVTDVSQIQIPLHIKYNFGESFGIIAGPNVAFMTGMPDGYKSLNYGVDLGAAYNINETMVVDLRYNIGLANLADEDKLGTDAKFTLSGLYLGYTYKF